MRSSFYFGLALLTLIMTCCEPPGRRNILKQLLEDHAEYFEPMLADPEGYRVQVMYTRIDRQPDNTPVFTDYHYEIDTSEYFYPASTVKLPVAALATERINELDIDGLTLHTTMLTDSAYSGQSAVRYDSSAADLRPTIAHYIKKIFLVSDNDAYNRLYEFLGQEYINERLHEKGYHSVRLSHRLSIPLSIEENRYTNPVRFIAGDRVIYEQDLVYSPLAPVSPVPITLGEGYIRVDSLIREPMDFTSKNFISLPDLHRMLQALLFPEYVPEENRFNLTKEDYEFLYRYMSMYPRESSDPGYGEKYDDNYCKFLMFADRPGRIPDQIRVFNKIGLAYGFLIETAYIVDLEEKVEFLLSAVINVNRNRIYNDGVYAYDSLGFPFMGHLGRVVYEHEKARKRKHDPDLSRFVIDYEKE